MAIVGYKLNVMFNYKDSTVKMNVFMADTFAPTPSFSFKENRLSLMFGVNDVSRTVSFNDKKYGSFILSIIRGQINETDELLSLKRTYSGSRIKLSQCNESSFLFAG